MSEASKEADKGAPAAGGGSSGGPSKLVLILTAVNVVVTLSMAGILFVSFQKEKQKASVEDIAVEEGGHGEGGGEHGGGGGGEHGGGGGHGEKAEGGGHGEKGGAKKKSTDYGKMLTLEQFTVNLSTPGSLNPKFARVNISIEVLTDDTETEVTSKMPQVRNAIIDLFNSKRPGDLATAEGRDYLKEEIRNALNGFLVSGKIKGVFFTNFALSS